MNVSDIVFEMELAGVDTADIASIVALCESKGFNSDFIDEELLKRGYPKIFNIDYNLRYYMYVAGMAVYGLSYLVQKLRLKI